MEHDDVGKLKTVFVSWSDRAERALVRGIILFAILLCLFQLALQFPAVRHWLTTTGDSEGVPFHYVAR